VIWNTHCIHGNPKGKPMNLKALLPLALLPACVQDDDPQDLEVRALTLGNGFQLGNGVSLGNGLNLGNGLTLGNGINIGNGVSLGNGLSIGNGLNFTNGLNIGNGINVGNGVSLGNGALLSEPAGAEFMRYLVKCALRPDQTLTVGQYSWQGAAGLAPEWLSGPCTQGCQEWVSSCLFALSNAYGESVQVMLRSENPAIGMAGDPSYSKHEGGFYGNIFAGAWNAYSVRGEDVSALVFNHRMCTASTSCSLQNRGEAAENCDQASMPDGDVETDCSGPEACSWTWQGTVCNPDYHRVITTYIH
jgi:hypothetical protein